MVVLKKANDTFVARVKGVNIIEKEGANGTYNALEVQFEYSTGNTSSRAPPITLNDDGSYRASSPGGRFLEGAEAALRAAGKLNGGDFDTDLIAGNIFRFEKVPQKDREGNVKVDGNGNPRTNEVPIEVLPAFPQQ